MEKSIAVDIINVQPLTQIVTWHAIPIILSIIYRKAARQNNTLLMRCADTTRRLPRMDDDAEVPLNVYITLFLRSTQRRDDMPDPAHGPAIKYVHQYMPHLVHIYYPRVVYSSSEYIITRHDIHKQWSFMLWDTQMNEDYGTLIGVLEDRITMYVQHLFVYNAGHNYGAALLREYARFALNAECTYIELDWAYGEPGLEQYYNRRGFTTVEGALMRGSCVNIIEAADRLLLA